MRALISVVAIVLTIVCAFLLVQRTNDRAEQRAIKTSLARLETRLAAAEAELEARSHAAQRSVVQDYTTPLPSGPDVETRQREFPRDVLVYDEHDHLDVFGAMVSSPSGIMVSDAGQKLIVGDLRIALDDAVLVADGATIDTVSRRITAKSVSKHQKPSNLERYRIEVPILPEWPNKSLQPTPTAVMPPAAQEIMPAVGVAEH
jgi:hypothetical protein